MQRQALWNRLYLSGIDGRAAALARENGLGLEIAAFCYAPNLEDPAVLSAVRADMAGLIWPIPTASCSTRPSPSCAPAPLILWCGR